LIGRQAALEREQACETLLADLALDRARRAAELDKALQLRQEEADLRR
jgi:hypothetical protein